MFKNNQNYGSIRFMLVLALFLGCLLLLYTIFDINGNQRELEKLMQEQSKSTILTLQQSSKNNVEAFERIETLVAEKLLLTARMINELYIMNAVSNQSLSRIAFENDIFRINIYNPQGDRIFSDNPHSQGGQTASSSLIQSFSTAETDELILGFRGGRFGRGQKFSVAKQTRDGSIILVNINSQQMLEFRKSIGLGSLVQDITKMPEIFYIILQDTMQVITASPPVDSVVSILADDFLIDAYKNNKFSSRLLKIEGMPVLEVVQPFYLLENTKYLLRVATDASHLMHAKQSAIFRAILSSLIILIIMVFTSRWLMGKRVYDLLWKKYSRMQSYTDAIFANMQDAVIAVDKNLKIIEINNAAFDLLNVPKKIIGHSCDNVCPGLFDYFKTTLSTGHSQQWIDQNLTIKNKTLTLSIFTHLIQDDHEIALIFAVIKDISAQKKLEENLKRNENISAMGHLAAGVAHEVRNPLNAISMLSQRLQYEFSPQEDSNEYNELTTTLVNETSRINQIINRFLEYTRPSKLSKNYFSVQRLLYDIETLFTLEAMKKQIDINVTSSNIQIFADYEKLKQVIINLLRNSIDACDINGTVQIKSFQRDADLLIEIKDDGHGIEQEKLKKIFNLYYTTKEQGTGIGLGIVQQIISQHNGDIEVASELHNGTVFTLRLPIEERDE